VKKSECVIGATVRCHAAADGNKAVRGKLGRVAELPYGNRVGVAFRANVFGHECEGGVTAGHGWYCHIRCLELIRLPKKGRK